MSGEPRRILTVGHGTLSQEKFAALLHEAGVDRLIDVRSHPGSRRNPQFARDAMAEWLGEGGVVYEWEGRLGGRRRPKPESPHHALRNDQFRAYADHMESEEFAAGVESLRSRASEECVAVMCAESVWWRCHRRLLSDALVLLHGDDVVHVMHDGRLQPHPPTEGVRVAGGRLVYDVGETRPML